MEIEETVIDEIERRINLHTPAWGEISYQVTWQISVQGVLLIDLTRWT